MMNDLLSFESETQQEIWQLIQQLNANWVEGHPEKLADFFHDDMVIVVPGFKERIKGKEACVKGYQDFCKQSTVHDFKESEPGIDIFHNTAVVTYEFEITYDMGNDAYHETGEEIFVFVREEGKWLAVWRTLILSTEERQE